MVYKVQSNENGLSLVAFLRNRSFHLSGKKIKRMIDEGKSCMVNGRVALFSSYKVKPGDVISFTEKQLHFSTSLPILYEDAELVIVNKPPYVVSDEALLKKLLKRQTLFLVHRLDKETTGVLLLAKNHTSKAFLEREFRRRNVKKEYLALVHGEVKKKQGIIANFLGPICQFDGGCLWGEVPKDRGYYAQTFWSCISKNPRVSLLLCAPITGKTHQIRVHLKSIGHPIIGDIIYGNPKRECNHHFLHAYKIEFMHPTRKEQMTSTAPVPNEMKSVCPPFLL